MKDFDALTDNKPFFDQSVKNKQEAYEKPIEMSSNDYYTTGNLFNFVGKLEGDGAAMFLSLKSSKKLF